MEFISKNVQKGIRRLYGAYYNVLSVFAREYAAETVFKTFTKVRKGRVMRQQTAFLDPAKKESVRLAGHQIQTYHWEGSGDTVLLIHGWESNSFRWQSLIGYLREHDFDIRAFDAPGHGYSSGQYLHVYLYSDCLQVLVRKYRPRYLVGHSYGGMTALYTQFRMQKTVVKGIVTIGSHSELHEIMDYFQQLLGLNQGIMEALDAYLKSRFGFYFHEFSSSRFVKSIPQKGLLFHDTTDPVVPFHASEKVHASWNDSILIATEGYGHSMNRDSVNKRIIDFLKSGK